MSSLCVQIKFKKVLSKKFKLPGYEGKKKAKTKPNVTTEGEKDFKVKQSIFSFAFLYLSGYTTYSHSVIQIMIILVLVCVYTHI